MKRLTTRALTGATLGLLAALPFAAQATTGYFSLGYGAKAMGLAGAVVSNPQDSLAAAANPAGMAAVGKRRLDIGTRLFSPVREARLSAQHIGAQNPINSESTDKLFVIPNMGFTTQVGDSNFWTGFSSFGNGGMNSTYGKNVFDQMNAVSGAWLQGFGQALAGGATPDQARQAGAQAANQVPKGATTGTPETGQLGVDFFQIIIAPTLAYKFDEGAAEGLTLGLSPLVAMQQFKAFGLGNFQCFTATANASPASQASCATTGQPAPGFASNNLTDRGSDVSWGAGVKVGALYDLGKLWDFLDGFTIGGSYQSKIYMTKFGKYEELFAENGKFYIPATWSAGLTYKPIEAWSLTFEYSRIFFGGIRALSNKGPRQLQSPAGPLPAPSIPPGSGFLGASNGLGFGWTDVDVFRFASAYDINRKWTIRGGVAYSNNPINATTDYLDITAAYMHGLKSRNHSSNTAFGVPGEISMYQNSFDIGIGVKF
jgi:long-chain fatty acid transport protein